MKKFFKIITKIILVIIALNIFLVSNVRAETSDDIDTSIKNEGGGLFEKTIGSALGGIASAVFNIATSDTINLGFKNYDELIFNKDSTEISSIAPFNEDSWSKMMKWYNIFTYLAFVPIFIGVIVTAYKMILAGSSTQKRNEAKDSLLRILLGGMIIPLAPLFVKLLLLINSNLVSALINLSNGGLDSLLGNGIFTQIKTGNPIATALVICMFAYLFVKLNIKFIIRQFTLIVFTVFTPLIAGMWIINKNVTGAAIWFGQIMINVFMQFIYAFLFLIYMNFTSSADGWAVSLLWAMMILPLGDALQNTMQNLVSRIAGLNNDEVANRGIGMGAAMAYTVHSIGTQFKSNDSSNGGVINRIKNITNRNSSESSTMENKTESKTSNNSISRKVPDDNSSKLLRNNDTKSSKGKISLYGIGRGILNTGMFMAEGRNFADKGLNGGNRRNYGQSMRKNERDASITQTINSEKSDKNENE